MFSRIGGSKQICVQIYIEASNDFVLLIFGIFLYFPQFHVFKEFKRGAQMPSLFPLLPAPMLATLIPKFKVFNVSGDLDFETTPVWSLKFREILCSDLRKAIGHPQYSGINRKIPNLTLNVVSMYCHALLLILRLRADNVTACPTHFAERTL
jgi:hypothetical protein